MSSEISLKIWDRILDLEYAIHSLFYWRIKENKLDSGFKNTYKKILETRKRESFHE